jgi:hypothetical protein
MKPRLGPAAFSRLHGVAAAAAAAERTAPPQFVADLGRRKKRSRRAGPPIEHIFSLVVVCMRPIATCSMNPRKTETTHRNDLSVCVARNRMSGVTLQLTTLPQLLTEVLNGSSVK